MVPTDPTPQIVSVDMTYVARGSALQLLLPPSIYPPPQPLPFPHNSQPTTLSLSLSLKRFVLHNLLFHFILNCSTICMVLKPKYLQEKWPFLDFSWWDFSLWWWAPLLMVMVAVGLMPMPLSMEGVMPLVQWVSNNLFSNILVYAPMIIFLMTHIIFTSFSCIIRINNMSGILQAGLVGMEIYTAKDMGRTQQLWAQHYSTMDWAVGLVLRWGVLMTQSGACPALLWSQPPTSARQTTLSLTMQGDGATLPSTILISLSLSSNILLSTKLGLFLWLTEGIYSLLSIVLNYVAWNWRMKDLFYAHHQGTTIQIK